MRRGKGHKQKRKNEGRSKKMAKRGCKTMEEAEKAKKIKMS